MCCNSTVAKYGLQNVCFLREVIQTSFLAVRFLPSTMGFVRGGTRWQVMFGCMPWVGSMAKIVYPDEPWASKVDPVWIRTSSSKRKGPGLILKSAAFFDDQTRAIAVSLQLNVCLDISACGSETTRSPNKEGNLVWMVFWLVMKDHYPWPNDLPCRDDCIKLFEELGPHFAPHDVQTTALYGYDYQPNYEKNYLSAVGAAYGAGGVATKAKRTACPNTWGKPQPQHGSGDGHTLKGRPEEVAVSMPQC